MTSVFAVDAWVLFGAAVQCALVLRARREGAMSGDDAACAAPRPAGRKSSKRPRV